MSTAEIVPAIRVSRDSTNIHVAAVSTAAAAKNSGQENVRFMQPRLEVRPEAGRFFHHRRNLRAEAASTKMEAICTFCRSIRSRRLCGAMA
jgi:hypothetical protein